MMAGEGDQALLRDVKMFITTSTGIVYFDGYMPYKFTTSEFIYGATRKNDREWYFANRKGNFIYRILFNKGMTPISLDIVADLRMPGVAEHSGFHQIDFFGEELIVADTFNNRLLCGLVVDNNYRVLKMIYPVGYYNHTVSRMHIPIYKHFNSVYKVGDYIYVVAHNETAKTGNKSQLFVFDTSWTLLHAINDIGGTAHNVAVDFHNHMYICDSLSNSLVLVNEGTLSPVFTDTKYKSFTRGLAINDDIIVVGGSIRIGTRKEESALLFVLDAHDYTLLTTISLPYVGQIYEIRLLGLDYGLSNTWRRHGT